MLWGPAMTTTSPGMYSGATITTSAMSGNVRIPDIDKVINRLDAIEERLAILQPNVEKHDKWPALKEAYENYKMIEKLLGI